MQPSHVTNFISPPAVVSGKEGQLSPKLAVHFEYIFFHPCQAVFTLYTNVSYPRFDVLTDE